MKRLVFIALVLALVSCTENSITTNGQFEELELPDGTIVKLNKNSKLSYDPDFADRTVKLIGEAFFDVTEGNQPFVVDTELGDIRVLGTEFNVKTDLESLEVQVQEGLVEISNGEFIKQVEDGMKATLLEGEKELKKMKADLKYKKWLADLESDFNKLGRKLKKSARKLEKEGNKLTKDLKREGKKLGDDLKEDSENLKEKIRDALKE